MLDRDERRSLHEIERHLIAEDPEWAMGLSEQGPGGPRRGVNGRTALAGLAIGLAVLLLILGQVGSAFVAGALAAVLVATRSWRLHAHLTPRDRE